VPACLTLFAVMGYITRNSDIIKALNNIHRHLKPNGVFIFDVWNGLAVLRILPEQRIKEVENDEIKIMRIAVPNLRAFEHICEVNYKMLILNKADSMFNEINEKHAVRFYFPQEITHYLEEAGFEVLKICPFMDLNGGVDENVWNITVIARAVGGK
jgi:SAM-dependent methyltransferase